jgi:carboxyl-terminal processing protease
MPMILTIGKRVFLIVTVMISCCSASMAESSQSGNVTPTDKTFIATKLYAAIKTCFAHWINIPDFDLDLSYKNYLDQIMQTNDRVKFDLATMQFLACLHNGHTFFWDDYLANTVGQDMGFRVYYADNK